MTRDEYKKLLLNKALSSRKHRLPIRVAVAKRINTFILTTNTNFTYPACHSTTNHCTASLLAKSTHSTSMIFISTT